VLWHGTRVALAITLQGIVKFDEVGHKGNPDAVAQKRSGRPQE